MIRTLLLFALVLPALVPAQGRTDRDDYRRASALFERGLFHESEELFASLAERFPEAAGPRYGLAMSLVRSGRYRRGLEEIDRALALEGSTAEMHRNRGLLLEELGRPQEAEAALRRALELAPGDAETCRRLGRLLVLRGEGKAGRALLERALLANAEDLQALVELASLALREGRLEDARRRAERARDLDAEEPRPHHVLAAVAAREGRREAAREHARVHERLRSAREERERLLLLAADRVRLGYRSLRASRVLEAVEFFGAALEASPRNPEARSVLEGLLARTPPDAEDLRARIRDALAVPRREGGAR